MLTCRVPVPSACALKKAVTFHRSDPDTATEPLPVITLISRLNSKLGENSNALKGMDELPWLRSMKNVTESNSTATWEIKSGNLPAYDKKNSVDA